LTHDRIREDQEMKLTVLGGGGARIPALVRAVLNDPDGLFDEIALFEPDKIRRETLGRLSLALADAAGRPGAVTVTADIEEAVTNTDYLFSAIRVGGDRGRVIDEQVALQHGLVGQETTGPGGCAMALRTIPVVLGYCQTIQQLAPEATLINFTNPAGIITQAITTQSPVQAVGVCDTPSSTLARLADWLGADPEEIGFAYGGLNHLGWISSVVVDGVERIGELIARYEELRRFDHQFAAFDAGLVRRLGAIPTEYLYYYYDSGAYVAGIAHAGTTRGTEVMKFNERLITSLRRAWEQGGLAEAWTAYTQIMGARSDSYMSLETGGDQHNAPADAGHAASAVGGYEAVALAVIEALSGHRPAGIIVNTRNGTSLDFLDPEDVVEVPALVDGRGVAPLAGGQVEGSARGLVLQVKEYERAVVEAAVSGDAELAALALALHPLVPGVTVARELLAEYRQQHGPDLAYLH
jgi:6-phospho-beta-glucosidase